jgi:hypothetical protein
MNIKSFFRLTAAVAASILVFSCTAQVTSSSKKNYPPLSSQQEVIIFGLDEQIPGDAVVIKKIKTGNKGFTADPDYDIVIRQARMAARRAGGNAIQILEHNPPTALGSPSHRIKANILSIPFIEERADEQSADIDPDADYAILHIYRYGGYGFLVGYNLVMGDSVICKVHNNFSTSVKVKKEGLQTIWAQTEARSHVQIDFEFGKEYYLRCGIATGSAVGIPMLEVVESRIAKSELEYFKSNPNSF